MRKLKLKRKKRRFSKAFLRLLRNIARGAALAAGIPAIALIGAAAYFEAALPDVYYAEDPSGFSIRQYRVLTPVAEEAEEEAVPVLVGAADAEKEAEKLEESLKSDGETSRFSLLLGGVIPVKTVVVCETDTRYVVPSGNVFGLKMLTNGAVVAALSPIETSSGTSCPAQQAGLQAGDIILSAGGEAVDSFDTLSAAIEAAGESGRELAITYERDGATLETALTPVQSADGNWLAGLWVRDSSAGIGTITFYDPASGCFAALGHGVCDADTGVLLPLQWGKVCGATVLGVTRGAAGSPGELQGAFLNSAFSLSGLLGKDGLVSSGTVLQNLPCGLMVRAEGDSLIRAADNQMLPVASAQEVHSGEAQILSTIGGSEPQLFSAQIEKVTYSADEPSRNLVIRITDPTLIAATGGIVQGMSGSPILQDGKLVGAVTHVFVSDPEKGYGIFAETMLSALDAASAETTGDTAA